MKTKQSLAAIKNDLPPPLRGQSPIRRSTRSTPASVSLVTPEKIVNKRKNTSQRSVSNRKKGKRGPFSSRLPTPRTVSFSACWAGNFELTMNNDPVQPHTLILGTHPSVASLSGNEYYAHPLNAFWWIAGDCLGFRRDTGISPSTGEPYQFTVALRQANHQNILPYRNQLATLIAHGFALWDVVASCERPGSLDSDIKDEIPNDVQLFCRAHPSIRRIVFSNGGTTARLFAKHFTDWLSTGQLVPYENEASLKGLGRLVRSMQSSVGGKHDWTSNCQIALVAALSVSPAAARYSYSEKRDFWDAHCVPSRSDAAQ
jgi:G:T/U-mismatch repair DNA glycosylase